MKYLSTLSLILVTMICACGQRTFDEKAESLLKNSVPLIGAQELRTIQKEVIILDTRTPEEFAVSHLDGAIFIDYDNFRVEEVNQIPTDAAVVVYCAMGYRSERIGEELQKMGYSNVRNLYGGIFDWKNNDNDVVNSAGEPTDSVHTYDKSWSKWLFNGIKVYD